jgi:chromosome segregation ATPase
MARGGINKALVQDACAVLRSRGQNPSIDAVRVQLGNTGSKTTIARYLKELHLVQATSTLTPQERLSAPLFKIVSNLVEVLAEEAEVTVMRVRAQYDEERAALGATLSARARELEQTQTQIAGLTLERDHAQAQVQTAGTQLEEEQRRAATLQAKVHELITQMGEKQTQLQTLSETSAHARESLVHFRDAAKEQRETLVRQHEQQSQQLQQQLRETARTLDNKQEAVISLNRDNERLTAELTITRKQTQHAEQKLASLGQQLSELNVAQDQLKTQVISLTLQLEHTSAHNASLQQTQSTILLENERLKQRLLEITPLQP